MKRLFLFFLAATPWLFLKAQTVAYDFEVQDCKGAEHHLFDELDNGNVIVLELAMMNCAPCVTAGHGIENLVAPYETSNPGKVHFYTFGFADGIDCADMLDWLEDNGMEHTVFAGSDEQTDYYGGMGMPTIVVVGHSSHKVYYNHLGYSASQNDDITAAIDEAIAESSTGISGTANPFASVYPNPFSIVLNVRLNPSSPVTKITVGDITGRTILSKEVTTETVIKFNTESLPKGIYFINFYQGESLAATNKMVKRQ